MQKSKIPYQYMTLSALSPNRGCISPSISSITCLRDMSNSGALGVARENSYEVSSEVECLF